MLKIIITVAQREKKITSFAIEHVVMIFLHSRLLEKNAKILLFKKSFKRLVTVPLHNFVKDLA